MGKRNFRTGKGFGKRDSKPKENRGLWTDVVRENAKWENYYKSLGIIPEEEWDTFKKTCQTDLPLTFRITGSRAHAKEVNQNFIDEHVSKLKDAEFEGMKLQPKNLEFYPDKLGWQLDVPKSVIRKNAEFASTQRFLVLETTVGNISRQEAVSMIPPLLMDVQPHHAVLDMCAAPGSKTGQLVEALHSRDSEELATGFVVANDSDYKRSHMLVHQVKRLNSPNFLVVNHDAQMFPRINVGGEYLKFDRILCDVPCSGDGTMRKNINVWKDFTVGDGLGLHLLQSRILTRGIQLLKPGGRLVYSTCSMSPIENEAVVADVLRKFGSQINLVDCSKELPGLQRRPGLNSWKVFGKDMVERQRGDEEIPSSAFPPTEEEKSEFPLERCIRVYPHLQNTGGFFITVIEKPDNQKKVTGKREASNDIEADAKKQKVEEKPESSQPQRKQRAPRTANEEPFVFLSPDNEQLQKCWDFYDISSDFPKDSTLVRNSTGEPCRTIYYSSPPISKILRSEEQKLKIIHAGIKLFSSQRNDAGGCPWRVQNDSMHIMRKYLGPSRQIACDLNILETLLEDAFPKIETLLASTKNKKFSSKLKDMSEGCLFLTVKRKGAEELVLPLWKGKSNVNLMVNKHDSQELLLRIFGKETSASDAGKEEKHQKEVEAKKESNTQETA